ncbi:MAG: hypothetical protein D9V44_05520 [Actinobacteria bacterium]|nr:MAG: hypothetical protein D9V44_05520 [Actinomycetota bacterium]
MGIGAQLMPKCVSSITGGIVLFESKTRDFQGPRAYGEGHWDYLDRSGRIEAARVREFLDRWFDRFPATDRDELGSRLRCGDAASFESASFELILFAVLTTRGYAVSTHPTLPAGNPKHPDFLATAGDESFYVEAVLASEYRDDEISARRRADAVLRAVDGINSPDFRLFVIAQGNPDTPPRGRALANQLQTWLDSLDSDTVARAAEADGHEAIPKFPWAHDGWDVTFEAIPKGVEHRGENGRAIGSLAGEARLVNVREPIRNAIRAKGAKYGQLDRPLLIAVNVDGLSLDRIDEMEALFGQEEYVFLPDNPTTPPQMRRTPNGAWVAGDGPTYTRVGGAWIFDGLGPWNVARQRGCLYFNPWAQMQPPESLSAFTHARVADQRMEWIEGLVFGEILGLDAAWPE